MNISNITFDQLARLKPSVHVTAFADETGNFAVVSFTRGAAVVLELRGPAPARAALLAHVRALPDVKSVAIAPNANGPLQQRWPTWTPLPIRLN